MKKQNLSGIVVCILAVLFLGAPAFSDEISKIGKNCGRVEVRLPDGTLYEGSLVPEIYDDGTVMVRIRLENDNTDKNAWIASCGDPEWIKSPFQKAVCECANRE